MAINAIAGIMMLLYVCVLLGILGLMIYTFTLVIKALKIYIRNNS